MDICKTLFFDAYGIKGDPFWAEVNELGAKYLEEQEVKINRETNLFKSLY